MTDASGAPHKWREVKPWVRQEVNGSDYLEAVTGPNGAVKMFSITPFAPIIEFLPAPGSLNSGWILPLAAIALLIVLVAALGWPTVALVRRRYKVAAPLVGRPLQLHRASRATAWLIIALAVGWFIIVSVISSDLTALNGGLDIWMRLLQLILIVAIIGTAVSIWNAVAVALAPGRHWFRTMWSALIALSTLFLVWLSLDLGLLTASLNY